MQEAVAIDSITSAPSYTISLTNLTEMYSLVGQYSKVTTLAARALAAAESAGDTRSEGTALIALARAHQSLKIYDLVRATTEKPSRYPDRLWMPISQKPRFPTWLHFTN